MQKYQEINSYKTTSKTRHFTAACVYSFRRDRKHHWLQRICLNILQRLNCQAEGTETKFYKTTLNNGDFITRLLAQKYEAMVSCDFDIDTVYMGEEEFSEIARAVYNGGYSSLVVPLELREAGQKIIMGLNVVILPWMRGILVVPKNH